MEAANFGHASVVTALLASGAALDLQNKVRTLVEFASHCFPRLIDGRLAGWLDGWMARLSLCLLDCGERVSHAWNWPGLTFARSG